MIVGWAEQKNIIAGERVLLSLAMHLQLSHPSRAHSLSLPFLEFRW